MVIDFKASPPSRFAAGGPIIRALIFWILFDQAKSIIIPPVKAKFLIFAKNYLMKHIQYNTQGTCSILSDVTADDDNVIQNVAFLGGCNGNLQGICRLVKGQKIDDVVAKLDGIRCGNKITSCPDQLCQALKELKRQ